MELLNLIKDNDFAKGGLLMVIAGGLMAYARSMPYKMWGWFLYHCTVAVEVYDESDMYRWLDIWFAHQEYTKTCRKVLLKNRNQSGGMAILANSYNDDNQDSIIVVPNYGRHYLWFKNKFIIYERTKEQNQGSKPIERINMTIFGRNRQVLMDIVDEAKKLNGQSDKGFVSIFSRRYDNWNLICKKPHRPIDSIVSKDNLVQDIVDTIKMFESSEEWYQKRGIPWHTGILLRGPPGNGKTSIIFTAASVLNKHLAIINLGEPELTLTYLVCLLQSLPENSMLVLEDIDCVNATHDREVKKDSDGDIIEQLDLASILNVLDGFTTCHGMITFMTTNYPEKLDAALVRPGRMDKTYTINNPNSDEVSAMLVRFFPLATQEEIHKFTTMVPEDTNMATIQGHLMTYRHDINKVLTNRIGNES